jgi:hypothetical protein
MKYTPGHKHISFLVQSLITDVQRNEMVHHPESVLTRKARLVASAAVRYGPYQEESSSIEKL